MHQAQQFVACWRLRGSVQRYASSKGSFTTLNICCVNAEILQEILHRYRAIACTSRTASLPTSRESAVSTGTLTPCRKCAALSRRCKLPAGDWLLSTTLVVPSHSNFRSPAIVWRVASAQVLTSAPQGSRCAQVSSPAIHQRHPGRNQLPCGPWTRRWTMKCAVL